MRLDVLKALTLLFKLYFATFYTLPSRVDHSMPQLFFWQHHDHTCLSLILN